jgi:hypothetical protein
MLYVFVCMCVFSFKSILRNVFQFTLKIVILQIMKPIRFFIRQLFVYFETKQKTVIQLQYANNMCIYHVVL